MRCAANNLMWQLHQETRLSANTPAAKTSGSRASTINNAVGRSLIRLYSAEPSTRNMIRCREVGRLVAATAWFR